jgi:hypothetical protein
MTCLTKDFYDDRVAQFLADQEITNKILFVIAVDEKGVPHGFAVPPTADGPHFHKLCEAGTKVEGTEDSHLDCASWTVSSNPGGEATIGGGKWRW